MIAYRLWYCSINATDLKSPWSKKFLQKVYKHMHQVNKSLAAKIMWRKNLTQAQYTMWNNDKLFTKVFASFGNFHDSHHFAWMTWVLDICIGCLSIRGCKSIAKESYQRNVQSNSRDIPTVTCSRFQKTRRVHLPQWHPCPQYLLVVMKLPNVHFVPPRSDHTGQMNTCRSQGYPQHTFLRIAGWLHNARNATWLIKILSLVVLKWSSKISYPVNWSSVNRHAM